MRHELKTERDKACAIDAVHDLAKLLHQLQVWDSLPLSAQFSRDHGDEGERCVHPDSVYGHAREALASALRLLGVSVLHEDEAISNLVTDGDSVQDVLAAYVGRG